MDNQNFQTIVANTLAEFNKESIYEISKNDTRVAQAETENARAESAYNQIYTTLNNEQKKIVGEYIAALSKADSAMNDCAYIAGIRDCLRFLASYKLLK